MHTVILPKTTCNALGELGLFEGMAEVERSEKQRNLFCGAASS